MEVSRGSVCHSLICHRLARATALFNSSAFCAVLQTLVFAVFPFCGLRQGTNPSSTETIRRPRTQQCLNIRQEYQILEYVCAAHHAADSTKNESHSSLLGETPMPLVPAPSLWKAFGGVALAKFVMAALKIVILILVAICVSGFSSRFEGQLCGKERANWLSPWECYDSWDDS